MLLSRELWFLLAFVGVCIWIHFHNRPWLRDGNWHLHRPLFGDSVMRRWTGSGWQVRGPSSEETLEELRGETW